jgi:hypothetical protein
MTATTDGRAGATPSSDRSASEASAGAAPTDELLQRMGAASARTIFGEPIHQDGLVLVPAVKVGNGGGAGRGADASGDGSGFGFGSGGRPAGAFILRNGEVTWRPAVDVNRIVLGGQLVAVVAVLAARSLLVRRAALADVRAAGSPVMTKGRRKTRVRRRRRLGRAVLGDRLPGRWPQPMPS